MDKLNLEVEWQVDNAKLRSDMAEGRKAIEGVGQSVDKVQQDVNKNISKLTKGTDQEMARLQDRIKSIKEDLKRWSSSSRSSLGIEINDKYFDQYRKELAGLERQVSNLKKSKPQAEDILPPAAEVKKKSSSIISSIRGIGVIMAATFGVSRLVSFATDLFNIAREAEGVKLAFARLNDPDALNKLRAATKGTVSSLELMKNAVRADNFKIPMDVLAKGLAFAQQRAKDTGQSVDYLVNSFVDGIGRRSTMVLDNLGISASELSKELEKTGDFAIAAGNIIEREMAKASSSVDTFGERVDRLSTIWSNVKLRMSTFFGDLTVEMADLVTSDTWREFWDRFQNFGKGYRVTQAKNLKAIYDEVRQASPFTSDFSIVAQVKSGAEFNKLLAEAEGYYSKIKNARVEYQAAVEAGVLEETEVTIKHYERVEAAALDRLNTIKRVGDNYGLSEARTNQAVGQSIDNVREKIKALTEERDKAFDPAKRNKLNAQIEAENKKLEAMLGKTSSKTRDSVAEQIKKDEERLKNLLREAANLKDKFTNEIVSREQQEINAVIDSYDELIEKAKEFNKTAKSKDKVDIQSLEVEKGQAVNRVIDRQAKTEGRLRLEQEEKMYDDLLKKYAIYEQQRLQIMEESEKAIAAFTAKGQHDNADEARRQRDQSLQELAKAQIEGSEKYKEVMKAIETSSQAMLAGAFKTGKETVYALIDGMTNASDQERQTLKTIFGDFFNKGVEDAEQGRLDTIVQMASQFDALVASSAEFMTNLDGGFESMRAMLGSASQLASQLGGFFKNSTLEKLGPALGIFGATVGVIGSVGNAINARAERREADRQAQIERNNDQQLKSTEAVTRMLERQLELINEIYGNARLDEYSQKLVDIQKNWNDLNEQLAGRYKMTGNEYIDNMLKRLNNGETLKEIRKSMLRSVTPGGDEHTKLIKALNDIQSGKYSEMFRSLPTDIAQARKELIELERQITIGKADERTKYLYEQLQAQVDLYDKVTNKLKEETTGNSFSSVLSDVRNLFFENGENAADAWQKGFDKVFENYLAQKFSREYLEKEMQTWYDLFDQYAGDGISESERVNLQDYWNRIQKEGQARLDQMREAMGMGVGGSQSQGMSGRIQSITQDQADVLAGQVMGIHLAVVRGQELNQKNFDLMTNGMSVLREILLVQHGIANNTGRTADNTGRLEKIEFYLEKISKGNNNSLRAGGN